MKIKDPFEDKIFADEYAREKARAQYKIDTSPDLIPVLPYLIGVILFILLYGFYFNFKEFLGLESISFTTYEKFVLAGGAVAVILIFRIKKIKKKK